MGWKFIIIGAIVSFIGLNVVILSISIPTSIVVTTGINGVQRAETLYSSPIPALLMLIGGLAFLLIGALTIIRLGLDRERSPL